MLESPPLIVHPMIYVLDMGLAHNKNVFVLLGLRDLPVIYQTQMPLNSKKSRKVS